MKNPWIAIVVPMALAGCMVTPDYVPPEVSVPDRWHEELQSGDVQDGVELAEWWHILEDPILDSLIDRAASGNLDVRTSIARVAEARARYGVVAGQLYPDVNASGSATRIRPSEEEPFGIPGFDASDESSFFLGIDAFWEVDLWGRVARSIESATADVEANIENQRDVNVTLYGEVSGTYVLLRTLQERRRVAVDNVKQQTESMHLANTRFESGLSPRLDVAQAQRILASTEADIPSLDQEIVATTNRLAVLLGASPGALWDELSPQQPIPPAPVHLVVGIPADVLRQRPDIRAAERRLAAQTALVGVATAELYPQFFIDGSFGYSAEDFGDMFQGSSRTWSVGPVMSWNVFDGGRVRGVIGAQEAKVQQALIDYERTVLLALEETENAMTDFIQEQVRLAALQRSVTAAELTLDLSRQLYKEGLSDFQNVLDAQGAVLLQQDLEVSSRGFVTASLVRIYKSLGGGWTPEPEPVPLPETQEGAAGTQAPVD